MTVKIKKFKETDKEFIELARIDNLVNHDFVSHPDDDKNSWNIRDKKLIRDRILLYNNKTLIGAIYYSQGRGENRRTAFFTMNIDPNYNNEENRQLLYKKMLNEIKLFNCNKILTSSIYDHPNYKLCEEFLIKDGFKLVQTNREYSCDIREIDLKKYKPLVMQLESEGFIFYDSRDEMKNFPEHYKKLEKLIWTYSKDFPIPDGIKHTRMPFEEAMKKQIDFEKNSYGVEVVCVKNNEYIASTDISVYQSEPHKAWTGSLGVLKKFRRRGIATSLKIKAIERLLKKGISEVRTDNEKNNPMYKINLALGFKPVPFSLEYMKELF